MTTSIKKMGIPGIAIAIFIGIMLFLSFYFFYTIGENRQSVEEQGFRELSQLGNALKVQDKLIRKMVNNYSDSIIKRVKVTGTGTADQTPKHRTQDKSSPATKKRGSKSDGGFSLYLFEKSPVTKNIIFSKDLLRHRFDSLSYKVDSLISCKISYGDFLAVFLRKDFFSDFLLIANDTIRFTTTAADLIISPAGKDGKGVKDLFSLMQSESTGDSSYNKLIRTGTIHKVKINGIRFALFLIPVNLEHSANGRVIIGGLIPEEKISAWEKDLPANWVMAIIVVLLFMIFSLPILKIFIAGINEKFTRTLVTMVGTSIVVGVFLITVFATEMLIEYRTKADTDKNLESLNKSVQQEFYRERHDILNQLRKYNIRNRPQKASDSGFITSLLNKKGSEYYPDYKYYKTMFWADSSGDQTFFLTPYQNSVKSNVGYRKYFRNPEIYQDTIDKSRILYNMEPIYSNTSGEWILAFSTPALDQHQDRIVALTSWMHSIKSPVLPPDYEFILVEKSGKIWYHSDEICNLSDDLLKECKNKNLEAAFHSNASDYLFITLQNRLYRIYIAPIENTDLFLVTLFSPERLRLMSALTSSATIVFFGMIALLLAVFFLLVQAGSMKNRLVKGNNYFFDWLIPIKRKKEAYGVLLILNIFFSLLLLTTALLGWMTKISISWTLWNLLFFVCGTFILNFLVLNLPDPDDPEAANWLQNRILSWEKNHGHLKKIKLRVRKCIKKIPAYRKNYRNLFTSFMVSWLIASTVLPCIIFIARFHHEETKLYLIEQYEGIADRMNHRADSLAGFYKENIPLPKGDSIYYKRNDKGLYFTSIWSTTLQDSTDALPDTARQEITRVVYYLHYYFNKLLGYPGRPAINPMLGIGTIHTDSSYGISFERMKVVYPPKDSVASPLLKKENTRQAIVTKIDGGVDIYSLFKKKWAALVFFSLLGVIFIFVHMLIRKIVHNLFDYNGLEGTVRELQVQLSELLLTGRNAIVISLTDVKNDDWVRENWNLIDMNGPKAGDTSDTKLILYDFEENLVHSGELSNRVTNLEKLLQKKPVVLILSKSPDQLVQNLMERWIDGADRLKDDRESRGELLKNREAIEYFRKIIFDLPVYYVKPKRWENNNPEPLNRILKLEYMINPEVKYFESSLAVFLREQKTEERIILALQETFTPRYSYIWNSLSREERFILYQLAEGAILNMNNKEPVRVLFNKGILKSDERVEFTSLAFRNYILTQADLSDIEHIEKQSIKTGTWSRFRLPLLLLGTSIIVFLFATQQNVLSNLNAILLSVATLLGVYLKFSGMLIKENK